MFTVGQHSSGTVSAYGRLDYLAALNNFFMFAEGQDSSGTVSAYGRLDYLAALYNSSRVYSRPGLQWNGVRLWPPGLPSSIK